MPRINEEYLQSVVYLYKTPEDAQQGRKVGGTGFIVRYNLKKNNLKMYFIITNAHVIKKMDGVGAVRFNTKNGGISVSPVYQADWMCHPSGDDIAIISLNDPGGIFEKLLHSSIDVEMFATEDILSVNNIGPGSETFVVGRFIKHDGTKTNIPIVRFGNISMMPLEPVRIENGYEQKSFLIESRSLSGFSGSPVFVYINHPLFALNAKEQQLLLLGLDCGHLNIYEPLKKRVDDKIQTISDDPTVSVSNSGQMVVVPAWKIYEMLVAGPIADRIKEIEFAS